MITGMPIADARDDFARARRAYYVSRAGRLLRGCGRSRPRTLDNAALVPNGAPQLRIIPLDEIVGTVDATKLFDARFRPATDVVRHRWERVARAHRASVALPPIHVRHAADGYYVSDGRHRVSVACALGQRDIAAWVT
jgi:hypothetical protein